VSSVRKRLAHENARLRNFVRRHSIQSATQEKSLIKKLIQLIKSISNARDRIWLNVLVLFKN